MIPTYDEALADAEANEYVPQWGPIAVQMKSIPIEVSGGIGDMIVALPIIEELSRSHELMVYCNYPEVYRYLLPLLHVKSSIEFQCDYEWWMRINSAVSFFFHPEFDGFKNPRHEEFFMKYRNRVTGLDLQNEMDYHPKLDNFLAQKAVALGLNRVTLPQKLLGFEPMYPKRECTEKVYDFEPFITVHDGYETLQNGQTHRATKTWNLRYWADLVESIKRIYPGFMVVQLGAVTSRSIPGVDLDLTRKTKISEAFDILSKSSLHIDGDSGMVHAAHMFGVKSVVMFGPTPKDFFGYSDNVNLEGKVCPRQACWWTEPKGDWLRRCLEGHEKPWCMDEMTPEWVLEWVLSCLMNRFG